MLLLGVCSVPVSWPQHVSKFLEMCSDIVKLYKEMNCLPLKFQSEHEIGATLIDFCKHFYLFLTVTGTNWFPGHTGSSPKHLHLLRFWTFSFVMWKYYAETWNHGVFLIPWPLLLSRYILFGILPGWRTVCICSCFGLSKHLHLLKQMEVEFFFFGFVIL
jgi:hypothetical protein